MLSNSLQKDLSVEVAASTSLLHQHPLPTWIICAKDFRILFSNHAASEMFGFGAEEYTSTDFLSFFNEADRVRLFNKLSTKNFPQIPFVYLKHRKEKLPLRVNLFFADMVLLDEPCYQVTAIDVTRMVEKEQTLEDEKNRYKGYLEQSSEGIFCQDFDEPFDISASAQEFVDAVRKKLYISYCNAALARMYGYTQPEEMVGLRADQLIDFSDSKNIDYVRSFYENGFKTIGSESHEKDKAGNSRYFINNAIGIVEGGRLKRIWGSQYDITEKKKIEKEIKFLAQLVEQTSDILTASDLDFKPVTWNKAAERIYGVKADDVIGKDIRDFIADINYHGVTKEQVREIIHLQGEWRGEMHFTRPTDRRKVTLLIHFKLLKDEQGRPMAYIIGGIDITERKAAEFRLKESENRFKEVADSAPVMIWMADASRRATYVNKMWLDFTGSDVREQGTEAWASLVHPEDLDGALASIAKEFETRQPVTLTYRLRRADGAYRWVQDVSVPRFLKDGTFIGYIGSVVDIHDQKEKEEQLRYQANLLENVTDIIVTTDLDYKVRTWNSVAEKYYGLSAEEAKGKVVLDLVAFKLNGISFEEVAEQLYQHDTWEGEASFYNKQQELKHVHFIIKFIYDVNGNKSGIMSVGRDITERKTAETKLQESELFYRTLIDDSHNATLLVDDEGKIKFASNAVTGILGYTSDEVFGRNAFEFINPGDLSWALESFEKERLHDPEFKSIVVRLKKKNGEWIWCMVRGHNMLSNPFIKSMVIHFHDDTLRKKASDALKESEKRFRSLIQEMQIGVFLADKEGKIIMCNAALSTMLSIPEEVIVGRNVYEIMSDNMIDENGNTIPREQRPLTLSLQQKKRVRDYVIGVSHPVTGEQSWIMVNSNPVLNDAGELEHVICSVQNITERKKLEKELLTEQINHQKQITQATIDGQENERRELGKELHDNIGQQLTTVKLYLDMARTTGESSGKEMLNMALKGISDLINEVRAMSRSLVPHTLNDLGLTESLSELVSSINRVQSLQISFDKEGFDEEVLAANKQLMIFRIVQEQLNNVVKHANASKVAVNITNSGEDTILVIKDDGKGFDANTVKKGVGFTNIRNRAELFGGSAQIVSAPGEGCLVKVTIPISDLTN